ncbi:hypothetical protein GW17_00004383 [Ensete ventricosum]|nr:hypothetical protein GW17_00004383 [Ensete ventricosum]RZR92095.1 hypothetical protein BHM03_00020329 [Ensete ventricosum]
MRSGAVDGRNSEAPVVGARVALRTSLGDYFRGRSSTRTPWSASMAKGTCAAAQNSSHSEAQDSLNSTCRNKPRPTYAAAPGP